MVKAEDRGGEGRGGEVEKRRGGGRKALFSPLPLPLPLLSPSPLLSLPLPFPPPSLRARLRRLE